MLLSRFPFLGGGLLDLLAGLLLVLSVGLQGGPVLVRFSGQVLGQGQIKL